MNILKRVFGKWPGWRSNKKTADRTDDDSGASHLTLARESLSELISDTRLPAGVREALAHDYATVEAMLEKQYSTVTENDNSFSRRTTIFVRPYKRTKSMNTMKMPCLQKK